MIIFLLQHQIVYVLSKGRGEKEEKIFDWQKQGVGIGKIASGALANGTLLVGERKMLEEMATQGNRILLYKRYIDDILAFFESPDGIQGRKGGVMMEEMLNSLDQKGGSIKVGPSPGISSLRWRGQEEEDTSVAYLNVEIVLTGQGEMCLEIGIHRKDAAANLYIQAESAHPWALKMGVVKGELIRYLTRCTTEQRFERAWTRFRSALLERSYTERQLDGAKGGIEWANRKERIDKMDKRAQERAEGGGGAGFDKSGTNRGGRPPAVLVPLKHARTAKRCV